jgi:hypothetical protein
VKLTLLPMLASAVVAAQPTAPEESPQEGPPGLTEPSLSPPGLTPTVDDCRQEPDNPGCARALAPGADGDDPRRLYIDGDGWVFRGGFGHYFWTSGG